METLLNRYRNTKPAIVFEWNDTETGAEGWVVINSLRGGAAGGGTRMRKGLNRSEVEALAKIMEIKFSVSGPPIGGAKSGINFDPNDPRKEEVLHRWFKAVIPLLKSYYGTGGDLNVDEVKHVIPITEEFGLWHPQEGVVTGHFQPRENERIQLLGQLRQGVSKVVEDTRFTPPMHNKKHTVADMMTGYGVSEAVKHYYDIYRQSDIQGKRAIIQGWGNVAGAAGYYLAQEGVKIVGILDRSHAILHPEGLSFEEVCELLTARKGNQLQPGSSPYLQPADKIADTIWQTPADIFIPAAASKLVTKTQMEQLLKNGLETVACGANDPFLDNDLFYGETAKYVDLHCSLIPDFIANCGMARLFAYLMQRQIEISDEAMFSDVSATIREALFQMYKNSTSKVNLLKTGLNIALKKLILTG
ncbi:amino acid dehydrogenase [Sphingobacteriales bacterium UPWRP_1]|nr:amino acid dehydrogenase [Sphingobacteriales bacterium TSM_CSS]PSJ78403.1 amino acid dehydrogenase [Sphingobacteriales bacterium UPWRP_1]